jgi:hypothetical protein
MEVHNGGKWAVALRFRQVTFDGLRGRFLRFTTLVRQASLELTEVDWSTFKPDQFLRQGDGAGAKACNKYR